MKSVRVTLAKFKQIVNSQGNFTDYLESKGFDLSKDWSKGVEKDTGDYIFMQGDKKKIVKTAMKVAMDRAKKGKK